MRERRREWEKKMTINYGIGSKSSLRGRSKAVVWGFAFYLAFSCTGVVKSW